MEVRLAHLVSGGRGHRRPSAGAGRARATGHRSHRASDARSARLEPVLLRPVRPGCLDEPVRHPDRLGGRLPTGSPVRAHSMFKRFTLDLATARTGLPAVTKPVTVNDLLDGVDL